MSKERNDAITLPLEGVASFYIQPKIERVGMGGIRLVAVNFRLSAWEWEELDWWR
ncbi:MAG: hypothetical protein K9G11_04415 [Rickettsiaceae bacterium]|nr:hypothetical protein [Rickettsiaceae bacterium]